MKNHAAVARFALRGAGRPGPKPVSAPLSDPSAVGIVSMQPFIDVSYDI
jgi:hypothetical protein